MSESRALFLCALWTLALFASGCGGGERARPAREESAAAGPSGEGACALLMQNEVDALFGMEIGSGASESLEGGAELCSWPAGEDPALLLQIGPKAESPSAAVEMGEGYRVREIEGMSGPAAVAIELPNEGEEEAVAVLAVETPDKTVVLSPVGLGIREGTGRFDELKSMIELVAERL